ncbi:hypothetical protein C3L33_18749, partial [Rhododendron williamsianum]
MESGAVFTGLQPNPNYLISPLRSACRLLLHQNCSNKKQFCPQSLKFQRLPLLACKKLSSTIQEAPLTRANVMPSPTIEQFVDAVTATVLANKRWVPPPGKGSLYIRPLLMGSGAVLGLAPAPEYTFLIYVSPVGNYFKEGIAPIHLMIDTEVHRATPGGTGGVKTIGNYASVLKAQTAAKAKGFTDVLYLDCVHKKYLEEVSSCNVFVVKGNVISTPSIKGTILPGITRKSIIDVARSQGFQVEERFVAVDELLDADEVFCTGTAVVISPVGSITYHGERYKCIVCSSEKLETVKKHLSEIHPEVLFLQNIKRLSVRENRCSSLEDSVSAISIRSETNLISTQNQGTDSRIVHLSVQEGLDMGKATCCYYIYRQRFPVKPKNVVDGPYLWLSRLVIDCWCLCLPAYCDGD